MIVGNFHTDVTFSIFVKLTVECILDSGMNKSKQEIFLELYEPIHDRFERFCRARVYGNMEYNDLMNDTLLIAFEKFDTLRNQKAFLSFLCGISVRVIGNHHQKKKEYRIHKEDQVFSIPDRHADAQRDTDVHYLYQALASLNEDQREGIILFEITGFSIKEIAEIQGASESAVKQRLKRGREKLIEIMTFESSHKTGEVKNG
ncbi:MAG: RNA polymerase sigma factor [Crocinitomicaceae bacterium]|nr:RNA polymerase sigma factor [Crocinitomicaceae bacterium]